MSTNDSIRTPSRPLTTRVRRVLPRSKTLAKLAVALLLPALAGCMEASPRWARAHALQDKAATANHALTVAMRHPAAPIKAAPKADSETTHAATAPAAARKTNRASSRRAKAQARPSREADLNADLGVKRLIVAHGVKSREPVSPAEAFSTEAKRIYAFVEVSNPERAESAVFVSFVKEGERERGAVRLRVGESRRWRTWAYTRLAKTPGRYTALVRDGQGQLLAKAPFEVKGAAEPADAPDGIDAADPAAKPRPAEDAAKPLAEQPAAKEQETAALSGYRKWPG